MKSGENLRHAGRPPIEDPGVFDPPAATMGKTLNRFEKRRGGPMPLSLRAWFEQVGTVNLMGFHETLNPGKREVARSSGFRPSALRQLRRIRLGKE